MREMGYGCVDGFGGFGGFGGFADTSGPKMEAELIALRGMLMQDIEIIKAGGLSPALVSKAQGIIGEINKGLLIVNREKGLDQWGSKAHDAVVAIKNEVVRRQSALTAEVATAKPMPVKATPTPTGNGAPRPAGAGLTGNQKLAAVGIVGALGIAAMFAMRGA
jgi:hypothetical protein